MGGNEASAIGLTTQQKRLGANSLMVLKVSRSQTLRRTKEGFLGVRGRASAIGCQRTDNTRRRYRGKK